MNFSEKIELLSNLYGIVPYYHDIWGKMHKASTEQKVKILHAMGISVGHDHETSQSLEKTVENILNNPCPPVVSAEENSVVKILVAVEARTNPTWIEWAITRRGKIQLQGKENPANLQFETEHYPKVGIKKYLIPIQVNLKYGYYELYIRLSTGKLCNILLIVAPKVAYHEIPKCWGLNVQLYSIRSQRNLGIGDFGDLHRVMQLASKWGASFVGTNPLYCLYPENYHHISPYSPSTRRFLNPWYINIEAIPELEYADIQDISAHNFIKSPFVEYSRIIPLKKRLLEKAFDRFLSAHARKNTARWKNFQKFIEKKGTILDSFAKFEALRQLFSSSWINWPQDLKGKKRIDKHVEERKILYHKFLQFLAEEQLQFAINSGKSLQPQVFLYLDFPIGVDAAGFDVWYEPELYSLSVEIGAPPDDFNPVGQKWGVVPFIPHKLVNKKFQPFIEMLRTTMKFCSFLRLDHVMGLMRLFWIPNGDKPEKGLYVRYPFEDLLRIIALESVKNKCTVIGEDLGTVPDNVRTKMKEKRIFSYRVLYFEKKENGSFKKPDEYPLYALATESTHDLPTLVGYWKKRDLKLRYDLKLISKETYIKLINQRQKDKEQLLKMLKKEKFLNSSSYSLEEIINAILTFIAKSKSLLVAIQIDDLIKSELQPNLPGTTQEYPSWRIALPKSLEEIETNEDILKLTKIITKIRETNL